VFDGHRQAAAAAAAAAGGTGRTSGEIVETRQDMTVLSRPFPPTGDTSLRANLGTVTLPSIQRQFTVLP